MAWFEDLKPCGYFGESLSPFLRAAGWLEPGKPFTTGSVDPAVADKLVELQNGVAKLPWAWMLLRTFFGKHTCGLCLIAEGHRNLFIPGEKCIYAAPELITHYIDAHAYLPPKVFCEAVVKCPPIESKAYVQALLNCEGGPLLGTDLGTDLFRDPFREG